MNNSVVYALFGFTDGVTSEFLGVYATQASAQEGCSSFPGFDSYVVRTEPVRPGTVPKDHCWYVDEYQVGWQIERRSAPSLTRWPVSHGPFKDEETATEWAAKNLKM